MIADEFVPLQPRQYERLERFVQTVCQHQVVKEEIPDIPASKWELVRTVHQVPRRSKRIVMLWIP